MPVSITKVKEIAKVKELFDESGGSAGARSIAQMATGQGVPLSRYRDLAIEWLPRSKFEELRNA